MEAKPMANEVSTVNMANISMRDTFFNQLYNIAQQDKQVVLMTGDFGAPSLDKFRRDLASQYINAGVAEQNMVAIASGLALSGKIVYLYSIAPFVTLRCYEQIKLDVSSMNLHVTALGVGAGYSYSASGPTHHATEDIAIMRGLPGMTILNPSDNVMVAAFAEMTYKKPGPNYVRFDRDKFPLIYDEGNKDFSAGLTNLKTGRDLAIVATGVMTHQAFKVADELARHDIDAGIIDFYRLKPVNEELLLKSIRSSKRVVTLEENLLNGGIGSIVAEVMADSGRTRPLKRFATQDQYCFKYGSREDLHACLGLDVASVSQAIRAWLR